MNQQNLSIKEKNESFQQLSKAEQRRAIALDVIKQIKLNKYNPNHIYFSMHCPESLVDVTSTERVDLQEILLNKSTTCDVCALGACFASIVSLSNNFTIPNTNFHKSHNSGIGLSTSGLDYGSRSVNEEQSGFNKKMEEFFDREELRKIEHAYEQWKYTTLNQQWYENFEYNKNDDSIFNFGNQFEDSSERMLAIMQSIADHPEGLFVPNHALPGSSSASIPGRSRSAGTKWS